MSLNQATSLKLLYSSKKRAEKDHQEAAAIKRPSLIARISVRMAESAVISLLKWSKIFPEWSRKIPPIPVVEDSAEKDSYPR